MQEEKKATEETIEQELSLNDDRRVKVLSPGALVAKRFFRNRLAVVGLTMLVVMFVFSFIVFQFFISCQLSHVLSFIFW